MKKDLNWLREQIKNEMNGWDGGNPDYFRGAEDAYEDVKDWLNQLDEPEILSQELPVIPKFVAAVLEKNKRHNFKLIDTYSILIERDFDMDRLVQDWLQEDWTREETFARAWLDGYTVEEEQKYNVRFKVKSSFGTVGIFLYKEGDEVLAGDNFKAYYPKEEECRLTEQEIRGFQNGDILFEHFAVKVEELEE